MIKWSAFGLLLLITESTSIECDNCSECETCIDQMCFSPCTNMTGAGACDCFGDICFDKDWCNIYDEVCCRTCENNWAAVIAIIVGLVGSIVLVVLYHELIMLNHSEERVKLWDSKLKIREEDKAKSWPKVEIIGIRKPWSSGESVIDNGKIDTSFGGVPRLSEEVEIKNSYHGARSRTSREAQMKTTNLLDFWKMSTEAGVQHASFPTLPSHISEDKLSVSLDLLSDINTTSPTVPGVHDEAMNDSDTLRFVRIPGLASRLGFSKPDLSSHYKTDERHPPSPRLSKNFGNMFTGNRRPSNWDSFFDSHSTLMCTKRTEHTGTSGPHSLEWMEWAKTRRDASFSEIDKGSSRENTPEPKSLRKEGEILLSYYSKRGLRYTFIPFDILLEDVASWLNKDSVHSIPISQNTRQRTLTPKSRAKPSGQTIADIFGGDLDPEKDGITCFIGPVDGRISFKMSKCDLDQLEKLTSDRFAIASPISSKKEIEFVT